MTWDEWCRSKYNTIGAYVEDDRVKSIDNVFIQDSVNGAIVHKDDLIIENLTYRDE